MNRSSSVGRRAAALSYVDTVSRVVTRARPRRTFWHIKYGFYETLAGSCTAVPAPYADPVLVSPGTLAADPLCMRLTYFQFSSH